MILDLNMPLKDGEQMLAEIRALEPDFAILVLTGRQDIETRVRCLDRGADDFLTKPFSLEELAHGFGRCCGANVRRGCCC